MGSSYSGGEWGLARPLECTCTRSDRKARECDCGDNFRKGEYRKCLFGLQMMDSKLQQAARRVDSINVKRPI
jgi:hypothetical protein